MILFKREQVTLKDMLKEDFISRTNQILFLVMLLLNFFACGKSDFKGARNPTSPTQPPSGDIKIPVQPTPTPQPSAKPPSCIHQRVLIFDLLSGWMPTPQLLAAFTKAILDQVREECRSLIQFEYHHVVGGFDNRKLVPNSSNIPTDDVNNPAYTVGSWTTLATNLFFPMDSFTQVFFFSGQENDASDIPLAHPYFQDILQQLSTYRKGFWIGAGGFAIEHANALLQKLGLITRITALQTSTPNSTCNMALQNHFLFKGISELTGCNGAWSNEGEFTTLMNFSTAPDHIVLSELVHRGRRIILDANIGRILPIFDPIQPTNLEMKMNDAKIFANFLQEP